MTDTAERLSPALAGRYVVDRKIGEGGMAAVYLARDVRHNRKVAIKVFHPELSALLGAERFLQEIELTANLQHPHVLPLFDSGAAEGLLYYVMPYVDGESLRARLDRDRQLPIAEAVSIACDVAGALDYAHKRGVVHRDIKPENILLYEGRPVVADFGIALAVEKAGGTRMTQTGMSLGTPHYMAPEQAMGERDITPRSDIYALGAVLYEMLVGEPPFTGPTSQAVIARVVTEEPRSLVVQRKSVPPHVEAAVHTALAKIPADRFSSAAQFAEALTRIDYAPTAARRAATVAATTSWRRRLLTALPWVLFAAAAGVAAFLATRTSTPEVTWHRVMLWRTSTPPNVVGRFMALAPDDKAIAYADTVGGKQQLWLKENDRLDALPLVGTDDATSPVFSPDGMWIAYASGGKVKKVPRLGGASVTVADSAGPGIPTLAWLDGGTILFGNNAVNALFAVKEDGSDQRRLLNFTNDTAARLVVSATGLPGGEAALVTVCTPGCQESELQRVDVRSGRTAVLTGDALKGWFVNGRVVFVRPDGGVFAAPFDPQRDRFSGAAVPVLEGVRTTLIIADMEISRAGTLVYIPGAAQSGATVEPVAVTRRGEVSTIDSGWQFMTPGNYGIALSPDARRLAVGARIGGAEDIWIKSLDRGPFTRLTFDGSNVLPRWTRDGARVLYTSVKRGGNIDLRARRADGTGPESTLVDLRRSVIDFELTPNDGEYILRLAQPPSRDIVLARRGDTAFTPLAAEAGYDEVAPTLSPNGRWLAYSSNETGRFEVYVRPYPDVNSGKWQISRNGGNEPAWAHNGRELFFRSRGSLMVAEVSTSDVFSVGEIRTLFQRRGFVGNAYRRLYEVAPGDSRFIFIRNAGVEGEQELQPVVLVRNWGRDMRRSTTR